MSYTTSDFSESLSRVSILPSDVARVIAAWGKGEGMGDEPPHYRFADESRTEWYGGFLIELKSGGFAYITGWCDYTGWGCQDGAEIHRFFGEPNIAALRVVSKEHNEPLDGEWDHDPADLNKWIAEGAKDPDAVTVDD